MADKKSFILYKDSLKILKKMSDEQAGQLFKAIAAYQEGETIEMDFGIQMAFAAFESQFTRDAVKYDAIANRNKTNGLKGGRPKSQPNPEEPKKTQSVFQEPKKPDSDNGSDSVNVISNNNTPAAQEHTPPKKRPVKKRVPKTQEPDHLFLGEGNKFVEWWLTDEIKPPNIPDPTDEHRKKWAMEYCRLRDMGITKEDIKLAVKWARQDSFWRKNFLTPMKLRRNNDEGIMYIHVFLNRIFEGTPREGEWKNNLPAEKPKIYIPATRANPV